MTNPALKQSSYSIYHSVISTTLQGEEQLPSLPSLTLKIRQAVFDSNVDHQHLSNLIARDPSLTAIILKYATSPMNRTQQLPNTIKDAISLIGLETVDKLVMTHSIKSVFVMKNPTLKKYFDKTWRRLLLKAGISNFLSHKLLYQPVERPMIASLLSEIGTLLLISALNDVKPLPDEQTYSSLCRDYSIQLGVAILKKWNMEEDFVDVIRRTGDWCHSTTQQLSLLDLVNLALFHVIGFQHKGHTLPPITTLAAFNKLPKHCRSIDEIGRLHLVSRHQEEIKNMITALS